MRGIATSLLLLCSLATVPAIAGEPAKVTPLRTEPLRDDPGKEVVMFLVDYPPGGVDPAHVHNAQTFVYVLEGSIVMGVKGGKEVTLTPGQTFHEGPNEVHTVSRNASKTQPAKFLVVMLKKQGAPILTPLK
jgi:quercetin dioxygenase-like cupin family protein